VHVVLLAELANSASAGGKTAIAGMAESTSKIGLAELGKSTGYTGEFWL